MYIFHIITRLCTRFHEKRRFSWLRLAYWVALLGVALATIFLITSPAHATSNTPTTHTSARGAQTSTLPRAGGCDYGYFSDVNAAANPKVGAPFGLGTFLYFTDPSLTVCNSSIQTIWWAGVGVVDVLMAFLIMANAIRIMTSGSIFRYADAAETLPRVLLAIIMAHLSLSIIAFFVGMSNSLCNGVATLTSNTATNAIPLSDLFGFGQFELWKLIVGIILMIVSAIIAAIPVVGAILSFAVNAVAGIVAGSATALLIIVIMLIILFFTKLVLALMIIGQLLIRVMLLNLYIIFAAPCIACSALPGRSGQPVTRMWLQGFLTLTFVQLVQVAGLGVAIISVEGDLGTRFTDALTGALSFLGTGPNQMQSVAHSLLGVIILWFILRIPGLLGGAPMQTMANGGQLLSGMASGGAAMAGATVAMGFR
jgi:hypothetical protein